MQKFVRGNEIVCSGSFIPADGVSQPQSAEAVLKYLDTTSQPATSIVPLAQNEEGIWQGAWDSSLASEGVVEWVIRCSNGLKAAAQGSFRVVANAANV